GSSAILLPAGQPIVLGSLGELARDNSCKDRKLNRGGGGGDDLCELARVVQSVATADQFEITPLHRQPSATSDGAHGQGGEGHPKEQTVAAVGRGLAEGDRILGQTGDVLAGRQIDGR